MKTRDIFFATFLRSKGYEIIDYEKTGRIVYFRFELTENELKNMKIQFLQSLHNEIKSEIEKLKNLGE